MRRVREIVALPSVHFDLKENFVLKMAPKVFKRTKFEVLPADIVFSRTAKSCAAASLFILEAI